MIYVYLWLGIGLATLAFVTWEENIRKSNESDFLREVLDNLNPERKKTSYRILHKVIAPVIGGALIVLLWPLGIFLKIKEFFEKRQEKKDETESVFGVKRPHLLERLTIQEVEKREMVNDPLNAVPPLPFGHLNRRWEELLGTVQEDDEVWSFRANWTTKWGFKEQREGYVVVSRGVPCDFLITIWKHLDIAIQI
jgi:hypothetical protein